VQFLFFQQHETWARSPKREKRRKADDSDWEYRVQLGSLRGRFQGNKPDWQFPSVASWFRWRSVRFYDSFWLSRSISLPIENRRPLSGLFLWPFPWKSSSSIKVECDRHRSALEGPGPREPSIGGRTIIEDFVADLLIGRLFSFNRSTRIDQPSCCCCCCCCSTAVALKKWQRTGIAVSSGGWLKFISIFRSNIGRVFQLLAHSSKTVPKPFRSGENTRRLFPDGLRSPVESPKLGRKTR